MGIEHPIGPHNTHANPANDQAQREREQGDTDPIGYANLLLSRETYRLNRVGGFVVFLTFLAVVAYTEFTREGNDLTRQSIEASERPYVSLGNRDGKIAEFMPGDAVIKMYFFNSGQGPALDFIAFTMPEKGHLRSSAIPHLERYREETIQPDGTTVDSLSEQTAGAGDIPGQAVHVEYIQRAKPVASIWVHGIVMYCDLFGTYHCDPFGAYYSQGIDDFVAAASKDANKWFCGGPMSDPAPDTITKGTRLHKTPLSRCRQPDETEIRP